MEAYIVDECIMRTGNKESKHQRPNKVFVSEQPDGKGSRVSSPSLIKANTDERNSKYNEKDDDSSFSPVIGRSTPLNSQQETGYRAGDDQTTKEVYFCKFVDDFTAERLLYRSI